MTSTTPTVHPVRCFCGAQMATKPSKFHEGRIYYVCPRGNCDAVVGSHPDGRPVGKPANKATRQARIRAHDAFDPIWKSGEMKRAQAYAWLREATGVMHIGDSSLEECERVVTACAERVK
jgi:hypothetical protein